MDIIKIITDWPVIIQGVLGSAVFWLILELGQRMLRLSASRLNEDKWAGNWFALAALEASPPMRESARFMCLYAAFHYLLKSLVVFVMSFAFSPFIDVFASVGYFISVYFLFRGLAFVPHTSTFGPIPERKKKYEDGVEEALVKKKVGPIPK